uniref:Homeobox domain-containing protein n=1 Tax=Esox lucius TaxID=8010 RepID=A0A6Q2X4V4_ESOLU
MANFSVEWLSKSCYNTVTGRVDVKEDTTLGRHCRTTSQICGEVFPRAPSTYTRVSVEAKLHNEVSQDVDVEALANKTAKDYTPSSPNSNCGYTTGSESEVGDDIEGEFALQRRLRTKFTTDQISRLERTFNKHKYLGATQRRKIAEKLKLSETQVRVKTWFQNRRMKLKREVQDLRPEFFAPPASLLPPLVYVAAPSFQHHTLGLTMPQHGTHHMPYTRRHGTK